MLLSVLYSYLNNYFVTGCFSTQGLFVWARLTELAGFPRLNPLQIFRSVHMRGWDGSVAKITVGKTEFLASGLKIFSYKRSIPTTRAKRFWQNNFAFATEHPEWHNFYFGSMWIIFVTKVTGVDKARIVANDATFLHQFVFRILSQSTGLKFLIWTKHKIRTGNRVSPVNQAHMKTLSVSRKLLQTKVTPAY